MFRVARVPVALFFFGIISGTLFLKRDTLFLQNVLDDTLDQGPNHFPSASTESSMYAFFNIFTHHIDFNIDFGTNWFVRKRDLFLRVLDEHDPKGSLSIIDNSQCQGYAIYGHVSFLNEIWQKGRSGSCWLRELEKNTKRITVRCFVDDSSGRIDMSLDKKCYSRISTGARRTNLHEMPTKSSMCTNSAFQVYLIANFPFA
jgi:hypothetical protein